MPNLDDRENDVISSEEFEKLEQQEQKKSLLKKIFHKEEKQEEKVREEKKEHVAPIDFKVMQDEFVSLNAKFDKLLINIEKNTGKIEMLNEKIAVLDERFININNEFGELRSEVISKDKLFQKLSIYVDEIKLNLSKNNPEQFNHKLNRFKEKLKKFIKAFNMLNGKILEDKIRINMLSLMVEDLSKLKEVYKLFDVIKKDIIEIREIKKYAKETLNTIDHKFVDLIKNYNKITLLGHSVDSAENRLNGLSQEVDKMRVMLYSVVTKDDIRELINTVNELKQHFGIEKPDEVTLKQEPLKNKKLLSDTQVKSFIKS